MLIRFYSSGENPDEVKGRLKKVKDDFMEKISKNGFPILDKNSK